MGQARCSLRGHLALCAVSPLAGTALGIVLLPALVWWVGTTLVSGEVGSLVKIGFLFSHVVGAGLGCTAAVFLLNRLSARCPECGGRCRPQNLSTSSPQPSSYLCEDCGAKVSLGCLPPPRSPVVPRLLLPLTLHNSLIAMTAAPCAVAGAAAGFAGILWLGRPGVGPWVISAALAGFVAGAGLGLWLPLAAASLLPARCRWCGGSAVYDWLAAAVAAGDPYCCRACGVRSAPELHPARLFAGLAFTAVGMGVVVLGVRPSLLDSASADGPSWALVGVGLVFVVAGAWILGLLARLARNLPGRYADPELLQHLAAGGVAVAVGLVLMSVAVLVEDDGEFPAGRGAVVAAGAAFLLAGLAVLAPALLRGRAAALAGSLLAGLVLTAMAAVPVSIALSDGVTVPLAVGGLVTGAVALFAWWRAVAALPLPLSSSRRRWLVVVAVALVFTAGLALAIAVKRQPQTAPGQLEAPPPPARVE